MNDVSNDKLMIEKTNKVLSYLDDLREKKLTEQDIEKLLRIQTLADEVSEDGN